MCDVFIDFVDELVGGVCGGGCGYCIVLKCSVFVVCVVFIEMLCLFVCIVIVLLMLVW